METEGTGGVGQIPVDGDACLIAAEQIRERLGALTHKINQLRDPSADPDAFLPVDSFLTDMVKRKHAPQIALEPKRLKDNIWTESTTAYVYAGIERAFVKAGLLPGGNRPGHVRKLRELRAWAEDQEKDPSRKVPDFFVQKTTLLFKKGLLEERRRDRIEVISNIGYCSPSQESDLAQLKNWIDEDLEDNHLRRKGRPANYQKIVFAAEVANLWNELTGNSITKGPDTNFAQFVIACWNSGFVGKAVNSNFKRTIRHHIVECKKPNACGRCENCTNSEKCERKRYFGILI